MGVGAGTGLAACAATTAGFHELPTLRQVVALVVATIVAAFLAWLAEIRSASPPQQIIQLQNCYSLYRATPAQIQLTTA